jgi:hypothetical protein
MKMMHSAGCYLEQLQVAAERAPAALRMAAAIAVPVPFAVRAVLDPAEIVQLYRLLGGAGPMPAGLGEVIAVAAVTVLSAALAVTVIIFGRRTDGVPLWPAAAVMGLAGNVLWWMSLGGSDGAGFLSGLAPMALMKLCGFLQRWLKRISQ